MLTLEFNIEKRPTENDYLDALEYHCRLVRKESRANSAVLNDHLVQLIHTDTAPAFGDSFEQKQAKQWNNQLTHLLDLCDKMVRAVEIRLGS